MATTDIQNHSYWQEFHPITMIGGAMLTIILVACLVVLTFAGIKLQLNYQRSQAEVVRLEEMCAKLTAENIELREKLPRPNKVKVAVQTTTKAVGTSVNGFFSGISNGFKAFWHTLIPSKTT
jgi:hypothetical protein